MDAAPPPSAPPAEYAPGDIYPLTARERDLCAKASGPDWLYLGGLLVLDVGAIWLGSSESVKYATSVPVRYAGPAMIGLTWGATLGGSWLALPKCSPEWIGGSPREGSVSTSWPVALAVALIAGATAPVVNGIAIGYDLPLSWSTAEREMHLVTAGLAGFGGALLPYLVPPRTWAARLELDKLRFGTDGRTAFIGVSAAF